MLWVLACRFLSLGCFLPCGRMREARTGLGAPGSETGETRNGERGVEWNGNGNGNAVEYVRVRLRMVWSGRRWTEMEIVGVETVR